MGEIVYIYRGGVERPIHRQGRALTYGWHQGYSEADEDGHIQFPWMTMAECRKAAQRVGRDARFVREDS